MSREKSSEMYCRTLGLDPVWGTAPWEVMAWLVTLPRALPVLYLLQEPWALSQRQWRGEGGGGTSTSGSVQPIPFHITYLHPIPTTP